MAKGRSKKFKNERPVQNHSNANKKIEKKSSKKKRKEGVKIDTARASASNSAPALALATPDSTRAAAPTGNESKASAQGKNKEKGNGERISGFIFMCNGTTKPDCYRYRVFGLPAGKMEVVEKIKPGTKLFLFDFDLKLLYGVYKATTAGDSNLERAAFGGRFPAQVRFKIFKDCLPLPESSFRLAIKDNYKGSKFNPELSNQQVKNLISMFRPIATPHPAPEAPPLPSAARPRAIPARVMEEEFRPPARIPPPEGIYAAGIYHDHAPPTLESRYVPQVGPPSHDQYGSAAYVARIPPAADSRRMLPVGLPPHGEQYYSAEVHRPYVPENPTLPTQDPYSRWYRPMPEMITRDRILAMDSDYHRSLWEREREALQRADNGVDYYNHQLSLAASHAPVPSPFPAPPSRAYGELPSSSQATYLTTMAYDNPNWAYAENQRSALGTGSLTAGNVPVSSLYSFAGAAPSYR